jgi:hypothetical protein
MQFFMVHIIARITQTVVTLPETFPGVCFGQLFKLFHKIVVGFNRYIVQTAPAKLQQTTRLAYVFGAILANRANYYSLFARL